MGLGGYNLDNIFNEIRRLLPRQREEKAEVMDDSMKE